MQNYKSMKEELGPGDWVFWPWSWESKHAS